MKTTNKFIHLVTILILLAGFGNVAKAQSFYINSNIGYAMNLQAGGAPDVYFNSLTTYVNTLKVPGSFGKGWNYSVAGGYYVLPYLAVELGLNQFYGSTYSTSQFLRINDNHSVTLDQATYGNMFRINPMVKITTFDKKIKPYLNNTAKDGGAWVEYYAKIGLQIGVSNKIVSDQTITKTDTMTSIAYNTTTVYSGGTSTGFNLRFGASFKQTDRIHLYVELSLISQVYSPTQSEKSLYYVNGNDLLNSLPVSDRITNYVPSLTEKASNPNVPSQGQQLSYPFTSFGINFGIEYKWNR